MCTSCRLARAPLNPRTAPRRTALRPGFLPTTGIDMWEQAIDSPEMEAMFNDPNQLRETMEPFIEMFGGECSECSRHRAPRRPRQPCRARSLA